MLRRPPRSGYRWAEQRKLRCIRLPVPLSWWSCERQSERFHTAYSLLKSQGTIETTSSVICRTIAAELGVRKSGSTYEKQMRTLFWSCRASPGEAAEAVLDLATGGVPSAAPVVAAGISSYDTLMLNVGLGRWQTLLSFASSRVSMGGVDCIPIRRSVSWLR